MSKDSAFSFWTVCATCIDLANLVVDGLLIGSVALVVGCCTCFTGLSGLRMDFSCFHMTGLSFCQPVGPPLAVATLMLLGAVGVPISRKKVGRTPPPACQQLHGCSTWHGPHPLLRRIKGFHIFHYQGFRKLHILTGSSPRSAGVCACLDGCKVVSKFTDNQCCDFSDRMMAEIDVTTCQNSSSGACIS